MACRLWRLYVRARLRAPEFYDFRRSVNPRTAATLLKPKSPASILMLASMHETEALRVLLESALIQVQMPNAQLRTLH
nr:hypothetical protein [Pseudomonas sp. CCOS 191]